MGPLCSSPLPPDTPTDTPTTRPTPHRTAPQPAPALPALSALPALPALPAHTHPAQWEGGEGGEHALELCYDQRAVEQRDGWSQALPLRLEVWSRRGLLGSVDELVGSTTVDISELLGSDETDGMVLPGRGTKTLTGVSRSPAESRGVCLSNEVSRHTLTVWWLHGAVRAGSGDPLVAEQWIRLEGADGSGRPAGQVRQH